MSDKDIEQQIQAKGLTAPRVTPQHIEDVISECHYLNVGEKIQDAWPDKSAMDACSPTLNLLTICVLVLRNGFTVTASLVGSEMCIRDRPAKAPVPALKTSTQRSAARLPAKMR